MTDWINFEQILAWLHALWEWLHVWVFSYETLGQAVIFGLLYMAGRFVAGKLNQTVDRASARYGILQRFDHYAEPLYASSITLLLVWLISAVGSANALPVYFLNITVSLLLAWVVIRTASNLAGKRSTARMVAVIGWSIAALDIVNLLDPLIQLMDDAAVHIGETRLSLFDVVWGIASIFIFIWLALFISTLFETRLKYVDALTPSAQVLVSKVIKIVLVIIAFLMALNATGIDLTALAVFGGALGVGIGFGLQKVVSNFISGVILLLDRSIKPGDVIQVQGTFGAINALNARYTSVMTRDGTEFLIPNEDMITQPVVNWSHTHNRVRHKIPVQVAYNTDLRQAMDLMLEAAKVNSRVLAIPEPVARILNFGENGVDLELRIWIDDPQNGVQNVSSDVMLQIWDSFHEANIEFPFPQRVIHYAEDANSPDKKI